MSSASTPSRRRIKSGPAMRGGKPALLTGVALLALLSSGVGSAAVPQDAAEAEFLPTPYTAEQIRDAWVEGFWVDTEVRTAQGTQRSRMKVVAWDQNGSEMVEIPLDDEGRPGASGPASSTTWEELRSHALFPAERAQRERASRETAFGELEGWLYTVQGEHGSTSEFFFADSTPGSPVWFRQLQGDQELFVAEQTGRGVQP